MLKAGGGGGKGGGFTDNPLAALCAQDALQKAVEDMQTGEEMRQYLMDRRPKEVEVVEKVAPYMKESEKTMGESTGDDDEARSDSESDDDELGALREQRMAQLKKQRVDEAKWESLGHGAYSEIEELEFLDTVLKSYYSLVHFYHRDFETCKIIDKHLETVAKTNKAVKMVKMDAEKARFFADKLMIRTLPTIVYFKDGQDLGCRSVGFEDFGSKDDFSTALMANKIKSTFHLDGF